MYSFKIFRGSLSGFIFRSCVFLQCSRFKLCLKVISYFSLKNHLKKLRIFKNIASGSLLSNSSLLNLSILSHIFQEEARSQLAS